jgi:hypothetical protein
MVARLTSFTKKTNRHGGSEYKLKHRTAHSISLFGRGQLFHVLLGHLGLPIGNSLFRQHDREPVRFGLSLSVRFGSSRRFGLSLCL